MRFEVELLRVKIFFQIKIKGGQYNSNATKARWPTPAAKPHTCWHQRGSCRNLAPITFFSRRLLACPTHWQTVVPFQQIPCVLYFKTYFPLLSPLPPGTEPLKKKTTRGPLKI